MKQFNFIDYKFIYDSSEGVALGSILSVGAANLWPETIHGFAVVATAIISAVSVFFTNRYLRKRFPENGKN